MEVIRLHMGDLALTWHLSCDNIGTMRNLRRILVTGGLMFVASAAFGEPSQSLFNKKDARPLAPKQWSLFGPKSSRYKYDSRMIQAAEKAAERARKHSTSRCWSYVKSALVDANLVASRPKTIYAKEAGIELEQEHGFRRLRIQDPFKAPLGSVLVYGGDGAGHVEFRTETGFVSDFFSLKPSKRPLIGVFVKPRA